MTRHSQCLAVALVVIAAITTIAQPCRAQTTANDPLQVLSRYVEPTTIAVVDVNVDGIDSNSTLQWAGTLVDAEFDPTLSGMASTVIAAFRGAGAKHVYLLLSTLSMSDGAPVVVIPCDQPKNIEGFLQMFVQGAPPDAKLTCRVTDGVVFLGPEAAFNRMALASASPRPDLLEPLAANSGTANSGTANSVTDVGNVKLVISLPKESRQQLATFWPHEFKVAETISLSPKQLVEDLDRVVAITSLPPVDGLSINLQTVSSDAAERVSQVLDQIAKLDPELATQVQRTIGDKGVTLQVKADVLNKTLGRMLRQAREEAESMTQMSQLRQVGLAMHNYLDAYGELPPRVFVDPAGKPLFSGMVALLPYLEQQALYNEFKLDQRWDTEANRLVTSVVVPVFCHQRQPSPLTTFRAPVYPGSLWEGNGPPRKLADITDGTSNTIAFIDAPISAAINWADPQSWELSIEEPMRDVFGDRDSVLCLFLDGSVRRLLKNEMTNEKLKAMLTIAGGEVVE